VAVTSHTAAPAALGYIYQCGWPLLALLRDSADGLDCQIRLEHHDDLVWYRDGTPTELPQAKHHMNSMRGLGAKDSDWGGPSRSGWTRRNRPIPLGPAHKGDDAVRARRERRCGPTRAAGAPCRSNPGTA